MQLKFSPVHGQAQQRLRQRTRGQPLEPNFNFRPRFAYVNHTWAPNQVSIARRFGQLHYLACHAPAPVREAWQPRYRANYVSRFGNYNLASNRYISQWSCHSWL